MMLWTQTEMPAGIAQNRRVLRGFGPLHFLEHLLQSLAALSGVQIADELHDLAKGRVCQTNIGNQRAV